MLDIFKLQLSYQDRNTVLVRVVESLGGEPRQTTKLPFDPVTESGLLKVLEKQDLKRCQLTEGEHAALRKLGLITNGGLIGRDARNMLIGRRLYDTLFPFDEDRDLNIRGVLETAINIAHHDNRTVPFQLRFDSDAVELACLPWELICDSDGRHLVAEGLLRLTRYITFGQAITSFPVTDRLEVLVITPRPKDTPSLDPFAERHAIEKAFSKLQIDHRVNVRHLAPPTLTALIKAVSEKPYHIIHFDGHGAFARRCNHCEKFQVSSPPVCATPGCAGFGSKLGDPEGCLAFELNAHNHNVHLVSAKTLSTILHGKQTRLFVASACQSSSIGGPSVFGSIGPRLILSGVPAVLSMQVSVDVPSAVDFASQFYAALARGKSIASAVSDGRSILFDRGMWHIPTIYLRNRDGEGFLFSYNSWVYLRSKNAGPLDWESLRPAAAAPYKFLSPYEISDKVVFFGRESEKDKLFREVLQRPFVVLYGPRGVGKTSLVNAGLSPLLIDEDYLVLTIRAYSELDKPGKLVQKAVESSTLDIPLSPTTKLSEVVSELQRKVNRPILLIFDQFEDFLKVATPMQVGRFAQQFAACLERVDPTQTCLLLVVQGDCLGHLQRFEKYVPGILNDPVGLGPLKIGQAKEALVKPLRRHDPPMSFDNAVLTRLLNNLCAETGSDEIYPTHLQIVCRELFDAAKDQKKLLIDSDLYPAKGEQNILSRYFADRMRKLDPEQRQLAEVLLKELVSPAGEREFKKLVEVVTQTDVQVKQAQELFDRLLNDGLLESRPAFDSGTVYSLSHHLLASEVHEWFDPEEAMNRCAQEALNRAWNDWRDLIILERQGKLEGIEELHRLLIAPDRLQELRARRDSIDIEPPQFLLLLRSAIFYDHDVEYWTKQLQMDQDAQELLKLIHCAEDDLASSREVREEIQIAASTLDLNEDDLGEQALARCAVNGPNSNVRHTSAIALGTLMHTSLGQDDADKSLAMLEKATPNRRWWRQVGALAQMKAVGFDPRYRRTGVLWFVWTWTLSLKAWQHRQPILYETLAAGIGAGFGLGIYSLLNAILVTHESKDIIRLLLLQPLGGVLGICAVAMAWLLSLAVGNERGWVQVSGLWLGFLLGLVVFSLPLALVYAKTYDPVSDPVQTIVIGGSLLALGIAIGWQILERSRPDLSILHAAITGGLGCAVVCLIAVVLIEKTSEISTSLKFSLPFIDAVAELEIQAVEAVLIGLSLGVGLIGGREFGRNLWRKLKGVSS